MNSLNAELLAPGGQPGRITLFTEGAIDRLKKENLFSNNVKKEVKTSKKETKEVPKKEVKKITVKKE